MPSEANLIAARYVRALFELAEETHAHDAVKKDLLTLQAMLAQSPELNKLLENPVITRAQAQKIMDAVLSAIKAGALTKNFFALLARERRLAITPQAITQYLTMLGESRGELIVKVTSAAPLSDGETALLSGALSNVTGKKIAIEASQNPALLGGLQIRIGSRMLDNSIAGKLTRLRLALTKAA